MRSEWQITKTEVSSDIGVVATMYPQATEAGVEMLERGGNAIDAAVAAGFAIGVVEPFNSGLGGIAVLVYHERQSGRTHVIDATGTLPAASRPDQFDFVGEDSKAGIYGWPEVVDDANNTGYRSVAVPGTPACLCEALERFGTIDRHEVMSPAIRLAEDGYPVDWYVALGMAVNQHRLHRYPESRRVFFREDGTVYRAPMLGVEGDVFRQPDLGRSLRAIAEHGAHVFYRGEIAELIAEAMEKNDGLLSYRDLADYRTRYSLGGLRGSYRGVDVIGGLENTGFPTVVQALNLLEGFDLSTVGPGTASELHLLAEAQRLAFQDRFAHLSDADSIPVPVSGLMSKDYASARRGLISLDHANPPVGPGNPWDFDHDTSRRTLRAARGNEGLTTHLTVVDRDRNLVSLLSTLGQHFGSAVVPEGTGIVLNNGTMWFDPIPGSVNSIAPDRRIMTAGAPTVLLRDGQPLLAIGAPGGRRVISSVIHSIVNVVDHAMGPQDAVNTPRLHAEGPETIVDMRVGDDTIDALRALGHDVVVKEETFSTSYFGRPNAVMVDPATGRLLGGVNQYKPTMAIGL